jgi:hypothetical protein
VDTHCRKDELNRTTSSWLNAILELPPLAVDGVQVAELRRQVAPRHASARHVENAVEYSAMILRRPPAAYSNLDQERSEEGLFLVAHQPAKHRCPPQRAALDHALADLGILFVHTT